MRVVAVDEDRISAISPPTSALDTRYRVLRFSDTVQQLFEGWQRAVVSLVAAFKMRLRQERLMVIKGV